MNLGKFMTVCRKTFSRINFERVFALGYKSRYPQRQLLVGYAVYSLMGTLLLLLPWCHTHTIAVIDHLFTAVSALSTTGLATVDVTNDYTFLGQFVILGLIQLGGLGYLTFSSYIMFRLTHHLGTSKAQLFHAQFAFPDKMESDQMVGYIVNFALGFELFGFLLLYPYFLSEGIEQPLWSAIFHTISAFCTAGFSIYSDNLMQFQNDVYINLVIAMLSYMGAMGFILMTDLMHKLTNKGYQVTFTTKVIVAITSLLTLWSTAHLFFFESSLQALPVGKRLLSAWFHAMSAITTVGFNTVDVGQMTSISLLILSFTMYIGASPSGTGGGLKSTTLSAIFAYTKNKLGLRKNITFAGHQVPAYRVDAALTTFVFYSFILLFGIYLIALFEQDDTDFLKLLFEASSALATAGLSSGILPSVGVGSKIVLILMMFIGRVGVITVGNVMLFRAHSKTGKNRGSDLVI